MVMLRHHRLLNIRGLYAEFRRFFSAKVSAIFIFATPDIHLRDGRDRVDFRMSYACPALPLNLHVLNDDYCSVDLQEREERPS